MSNWVVKYRPRAVSKWMVAVFVLFLLAPLTIAFVVGAIQQMRSGEVMRSASAMGKLVFVAALFVIVFRPANKLIFDQAAGVLRYAPSWSTSYMPQWARQVGAEYPRQGLATVVVEANAQGNLYRLVLIYRDGAKTPLTEHFYYSEASHSRVASELNARIRDLQLEVRGAPSVAQWRSPNG